MQVPHRNSNQWLKSINQQKVLRLLYTDGPISRVELAGRTGLKQQTITNIINRLLVEDLVEEQTPLSSSGGRKPVPLIIKGGNMYAIGIEIAVTYIGGALVDFNGNVLQERILPVPKYDYNEEHPVVFIRQVIDDLLGKVPVRSRLKGIGCSIQAPVGAKEGIVIYSPGLRWRQFPLGSRLGEIYDLPIYLENDANLLAVVENLNGALVLSENNVTLKFDYGIGGAIMHNSQLVTGATQVAGEVGHLKAFFDEDARTCHCGGKGCLTTLASVSGLRRNSGYELYEFSALVRGGEEKALSLYGKLTTAIGRILAQIVTFNNPDHVLLTGRLIDQMGDLLLPDVSALLFDNVPESCRQVNLTRLDKTPNEAVSAAGLVMNQFFDVPLGQALE